MVLVSGLVMPGISCKALNLPNISAQSATFGMMSETKISRHLKHSRSSKRIRAAMIEKLTGSARMFHCWNVETTYYQVFDGVCICCYYVNSTKICVIYVLVMLLSWFWPFMIVVKHENWCETAKWTPRTVSGSRSSIVTRLRQTLRDIWYIYIYTYK